MLPFLNTFSPKDVAKLSDGCEHLVQSLEHASMKVHTEMVIADVTPLHYDVFVSYSHKDSRLAIPIVEKLQKLNPKLRIFFDVQELKAGKQVIIFEEFHFICERKKV